MHLSLHFTNVAAFVDGQFRLFVLNSLLDTRKLFETHTTAQAGTIELQPDGLALAGTAW